MTPPTTETGIVELLPCPFCGTDKPMSGSMKTKGVKGWWIECRDCPALMEEDNEPLAIVAWNARAAIAAMPDSTQLLQTMAGALERIAQPVYVAEPARKADSAWRVALGERIEIARAALAQFRAQEQRS